MKDITIEIEPKGSGFVSLTIGPFTFTGKGPFTVEKKHFPILEPYFQEYKKKKTPDRVEEKPEKKEVTNGQY